MPSPLAILSTSNLRTKTKELEHMWENFMSGNPLPAKMRKKVFESWKRCQNYGVNPKQKQTKISLTDNQLIEYLRNSQLYDAAKPVIDHMSHQVKDTNYLITLCDKKGRIIYLSGNTRVLEQAELMNFVLGADWSEQAAGTNAIGTSIQTKEPIQIFSAEHFCQGVHPWTCSSAPIFDPFTGEVAGVLDLTGLWKDAQPHTLGIVVSNAQLIQHQLKKTSMEFQFHLIEQYYLAVTRWPNDTVIILNSALQVVKGKLADGKEIKNTSWNELAQKPEWSSVLQEPLPHFPLVAEDCASVEIQRAPTSNAYIEPVYFNKQLVGYLVVIKNQHKFKRTTPLIVQDISWHGIIGQSEPIKKVIHNCMTVACADVPILLIGESGTGKEKLAQAIHNESPRRDKVFLAVNCGAIPKELMASEMFGYEPGTFTGGLKGGKKGKFEEADGGTLFLDEIGEMPLDLQVHLLRVLQEKEVMRLGSIKPIPIDVRIIAATNRDLNVMIKTGAFRSDLFYRLNVISIRVPPLRERKDDMELLSNHFLNVFCKKYRKHISSFTQETLKFIKQYDWPGNIRELQNAIEHAVLFCDTSQIDLCHLPSYLPENMKLTPEFSDENTCHLSPMEIEEKNMLIRLLKQTEGNLSETARMLKIARTTLYRKLKKYNLK